MSDWHNVSKDEPCPICHKTDWCNLSDNGEVAICHRVESPYLAKSGSGWIHRLKERERDLPVACPKGIRRASTSDANRAPPVDFARIHATYDADPVLVEGLATTLGVDDRPLKAMDVRFNRLHECWSFPMRDAEGRIVGLRFRELGGSRKWSARGSHDGLFYAIGPDGAVESSSARELVIVEGPSDAAAALSLGLNAVGRSSCQTGAAHLKALIRRLHPRNVTIVADNDAPGIRGAELLAQQLACASNESSAIRLPVRLLIVPSPHKDIRAWYLSGKLTRKLFADLASAQRWQ